MKKRCLVLLPLLYYFSLFLLTHENNVKINNYEEIQYKKSDVGTFYSKYVYKYNGIQYEKYHIENKKINGVYTDKIKSVYVQKMLVCAMIISLITAFKDYKNGYLCILEIIFFWGMILIEGGTGNIYVFKDYKPDTHIETYVMNKIVENGITKYNFVYFHNEIKFSKLMELNNYENIGSVKIMKYSVFSDMINEYINKSYQTMYEGCLKICLGIILTVGFKLTKLI